MFLIRKNKWIFMFSLIVLLCLIQCAFCQAPKAVTKQFVDEKTVFPNALEAVKSNPLFSTYLMLLKRVGMDAVLKKESSLTVIVPTNIAFATLPKPLFTQLLTQKEPLTAALHYLVIKGDIFHPKSLAGGLLHFHMKDLTINDGVVPIGIMKSNNGTLIITNQFVLKGA